MTKLGCCKEIVKKFLILARLGDYFDTKRERDTLSSARFLPIIGAVLQILQMLVLEAVCRFTRSLHSSHITCPTLHCQILEGGAMISMQMGHSSSFLAQSIISGSS